MGQKVKISYARKGKDDFFLWRLGCYVSGTACQLCMRPKFNPSTKRENCGFHKISGMILNLCSLNVTTNKKSRS